MQHPIEHYEKSITIDYKQARYYDFQELADNSHSSNDKPILHFYGGNGFPVGVYEPLITKLSQHFHVISLAMCGYWFDVPNDKTLTREDDARYLLEFLAKTQNGKLIIGVGHSQGATATAMACAKRSDLFSKLFFLDPVTFTKLQKTLYNLLPRAVLMTQEPFKSTLTKQTDWQTVDAYYTHLRSHRAYRRISDEHLMIFANNSLIKKTDGSGFELLFMPKQELASYFGTPYITDALKTLNKTKTPYHMILGKPSVFNSDKVRKSWRGIVPDSNITVKPEYGHLLPMEAPSECADIIIHTYQITHNMPFNSPIAIYQADNAIASPYHLQNHRHRFARMITNTRDRDGYLREKALKDAIEHLPIPLRLDVLLERQNDYVAPIRELANQALLETMDKADVFDDLLPRTHQFLHLTTQSRTQHSPVLDKLLAVYLDNENYDEVEAYIKTRQGKAVRALYQMLTKSNQLNETILLNLALSSPDILVNMQVWDKLTQLTSDEQRALLMGVYTSQPITNKQFYFKFLMHLVYNHPLEVWQDIAIAYLPRATASQKSTLWFYLNQQGCDFETVIDALLNTYDEERVIKTVLELIVILDDKQRLQRIINDYPHWQKSWASLFIEASLILMPDHPITDKLIREYPDYTLSQKGKGLFFERHKPVNLDHYQTLIKQLKLTNNKYGFETLHYSKTLAPLEQLLFLSNYLIMHKEEIKKNTASSAYYFRQAINSLISKIYKQTMLSAHAISVVQRQQLIENFKDADVQLFFDDSVQNVLRLSKILPEDETSND